MNIKQCVIGLGLLIGAVQAETLYQDDFDNDTLAVNTNAVGGVAINRSIENHAWGDDGDATFVASGTSAGGRAILYSESAFQSDSGFTLTVNYTIGSIDGAGTNSLSFGLISSDTELSSYSGYNPYRTDTGVYSIGANVTAFDDAEAQGLNFTDGSARTTLDQSGTTVQFVAGTSTEVIIEIRPDGEWSYWINGVREAMGMIEEGFDLTKSYHVVIYGQAEDDKSIQSLTLESASLGQGYRADWLRGTWGACWLPEYYQNGNIEGVSIEPFLEQFADFKTMDFVQVKLTDGSYYSPCHTSPHQILESLWHDDLIDRDEDGEPIKNLIVPRWIDEDEDGEPDSDPLKEWLSDIQDAGLKTQVYINSGNVLRTTFPAAFSNVTERWTGWCDTNEAAQAFINSESYHSAAYDWDTGDYTDTNYATRAYMFCYAEFILKDYAIRYGDLVDSWIFDQATMISGKGDSGSNGLLVDQRIYEAFANAVHAGNPNAAVAFNNSPNRDDADTNPYTPATHFDDYMFGHPYGGSYDNASKTLGLYYDNYRIIEWNTDTSGYVHNDDPDYEEDEEPIWDDKVVGHYYPKMSTTSWNGGSTAAYEDDDFNQWNLEMAQAGGAIAWGVPLNRATCANLYGPYLTAKSWALDQLTQMDEHLSVYQQPGAPNWARTTTLLPEATIGQSYYHVLVEGVDLWDPEGDEITSVSVVDGFPSWLSIEEDPENDGDWVLSGIPTETSATELSFSLRAADASAERDREVELVVNESSSNFEGDVLEWASDPLVIDDAEKYQAYSYLVTRGRDFDGPEDSDLTLTKTGGAEWLSFDEVASGVWELSGTPTGEDGLNSFEMSLSDGSSSVSAAIQLSVTNSQYLDMVNCAINRGFWTSLAPIAENDEWTYNGNGGNYYYRGVLYSEQVYQSSGGFRLTVDYTSGTVADSGAHNFSFGLVSAETDWSTYEGYNPFKVETSVYSLGVNLIADGGTSAQGLNFTDGASRTTLDQSGDNVEFVAAESTPVVIEILPNGVWSYSIDGIVEASGVMDDEFDLSKSYRVVVYGQDDNGNGKTLQSISLDLLEDADVLDFTTQTVSVMEDSSVEMIRYDDDDLSFMQLTEPVHGTLSGSLPILTYVPDADYTGADLFTYQVSNAVGNTTVTVNITVDSENDTPTADAASMTVDEDESETITLTGTDIDGDVLEVIISTEPTNGTVTVDGTVATYTPNENYNGADSFIYTMNDGTTDSEDATVTITVNPIDDPPVFDLDPVVGSFAIQDVAYSGMISATDVDMDDTFTYEKLSGASWLVMSTDGSMGGTPSESDLGTNVFTVTAVEEGTLSSTSATLEIVVLTTDSLIYYDTFDDDTLGTNSDIGGGMAMEGTDSGDYWSEGDGELFYVSDGSGGNRADAYSLNAFTMSNGFTLEVAYDLESLAESANNQFSFGLVTGYVPDYENTFANTTVNATGIGFNLAPGNSDDEQGLIFAEAGDSASTLTNLSAFVSDSGVHRLFLTVIPDGAGGANWSYSYDGATEVSGQIEAFDLSTNTYQFVTHVRDISVDKSIQHIKLTAIPDQIVSATQQVDGFEGELISGGGSLALSWSTVDGASYGVAMTTNLVSGTWTNIVTGISGEGVPVSITNDITENQQFFRIYLAE